MSCRSSACCASTGGRPAALSSSPIAPLSVPPPPCGPSLRTAARDGQDRQDTPWPTRQGVGGLTEVLANSGVQVVSESVPQGGTSGTVMIGTFRMVRPTFCTLQMYSFWTGDQVARFSDTGPRGAVICTDRIAFDSAFSLVTLPCRDFSAVIRISALV